MPKLIVVRGPSGAGKSAVAQQLFAGAKGPVALIELDHYRFMIRNQPAGARLEYRLAESAIRIAMTGGFDVIFEGNFRGTANGNLPLPLLSFEHTAVHAFYLDVSLAETLRRHATREDQRITAERMKELYAYAQPLPVLAETMIPEDSTLGEAVAIIRRISGI
jgi:predicted kinase